jgi:basic membrane lipoprotein Med (substrate-binding protein (PBP1-ABC) superfamily)
MDQIYDFVLANKPQLIGVLAALYLFKDKVSGVVTYAKSKLTSVSSSPSTEQPVEGEISDQSALRHLRNRASKLGDKQLVSMIKEVDARFYDIHAGVKNEK